MWVYVLGLLVVLAATITTQYRIDINAAYKRLKKYDVKVVSSSLGKISYMDEGTGEAILISIKSISVCKIPRLDELSVLG